MTEGEQLRKNAEDALERHRRLAEQLEQHKGGE